MELMPINPPNGHQKPIKGGSFQEEWNRLIENQKAQKKIQKINKILQQTPQRE